MQYWNKGDIPDELLILIYQKGGDPSEICAKLLLKPVSRRQAC